VIARRLTIITVALVTGACQRSADGQGAASPRGSSEPTDTVVVQETFITPFDTLDNVDSPAVWHGADGSHWLFATAKTTDVVLVNDAATGAAVRRLGGSGKSVGELDRPNGVLVIDSLLFVVERDNHRVQVFRLPSFAPAGSFGAKELRVPYGIAAYSEEPGVHAVYVTDNYETADEQVPPDRELGARVKQFRVRDDGGRGAVHAELVRAFGDTTGAGALKVVESIAVDAAHDRLLIAEELETDSHIKAYTLEGRYAGRDIGRGLFPQQAEGIALYTCGDSAGYWLATDQGQATNTYHVFDRLTFRHLGSFTGTKTRLTDGIALTQRPFGPFPSGAFYASNLDGSVSAFSWTDIARPLGLRADCTR
jgi:3-phytase